MLRGEGRGWRFHKEIKDEEAQQRMYVGITRQAYKFEVPFDAANGR